MMRARAYLKPGSIFLFLIVCFSVFLLYRMYDTEVKVRTAIMPMVSTNPPKSKSLCMFQPLSPEEAKEVDTLLDEIAWPETHPLPSSFSLNDTSDPAHSTVTILPRKGGGQWHVGDEMEVRIDVRDFNGHAKKSGGDFLLARMHSPYRRAGVAGRVLDLGNGSYSAVFSLLWEGSAYVEVTLVHSSEAVAVLQKLTEEQPDRIYFFSIFESDLARETTICNVCLNATEHQLCNYTDLHTGDLWFCHKPRELDCDARVTHNIGGFEQNLSPDEEKLFQSDVNMKVLLDSGPANIEVLSKPKVQSKRIGRIMKTGPSGFYHQGLWQALDDTTVHHFYNSSAISRCLKGKAVHLYGDSTIRQWFRYIVEELPDLNEFNLHSRRQNGPFIALDYANNILLTYRCHGPPIRFATVPVSQLRYIANELDGLVGGTNTVVVIGIWSHFSTFPIEVYIRRLQGIRRAVARLLTRAPDTRVVIRTANPKELTLYEALTNSDWYSAQRDKVLRAMFRGMDVRLVDAWEMILAHQLPHSLHPKPPIIKNMMNVLLSHICPLVLRLDFIPMNEHLMQRQATFQEDQGNSLTGTK
ncbi:NXPE family member 3-like [Menidia menidia]